MAEPSDQKTGHETRDVNTTVIGCFALALVVGAIVIHVLLARVFYRLDESTPGGAASRITSERITAPQPQLQTDPAREMAHFRAVEEETLASYGWVDRKAGVARIPVERAMELIAERGLPAAPNSIGKTPAQMRGEKAKEPAR